MKTNVVQEHYLAHLLMEAVTRGNAKLINEAVKAVAATLKKHRRLGMAERVIREYRRLLIKHNMTTEMVLESAQALPESLQNKIKESLAIDKQVPVKSRIKPELIGGAVVQYRNTRWDFSIKAKLSELKKQLSAQ